MKKILFAAASVAMLLGVSSCKDTFKSDDYSAFADSLATVNAQMYGANLRNQLPMMEMQYGEKFNRASFEKGLKAGMTLDTADVAYIIGLNQGIQMVGFAYQLAAQGFTVDQAMMAKAAIAAMNDSTLNVNELYVQANALQARMQQIVDERAQKQNAEKAEANLKAGQDYVAELQKKDENVKVTESGLAYTIQEAGDESRVGPGDMASVIYTGKHLNGEVFDSSNGEAIDFDPDHLVPGFTEGLKLIGKGGKATLYIPGNLAYGEMGQPRAGIEPNEMLVFEIEITKIAPKNDL